MMNDDKLIRLSAAVDLCMKKAKFYQPEMFGSDQECFTAKVVATELAGEIRNLPGVDAETHIQQIEEKYKHAMENAKILSDAVTKLERERDFLLKYFTDSHWAACDICKHEPESHDINDCAHIRKVGLPCFEWRGLPEDDHGR